MKVVFLLAFIAVSVNAACNCSSSLRIGQFNVGQEPFEVFRAERMQATIQYLLTTNFDVLCMEDIWSDADKTTLINGIKPTYSNAFTPPDKPITCTSGCNSAELNNIVDCAANQACSITNSVIDYISCLEKGCAQVFDKLSDTCKDCLLDPFHPTIDDKLTRCAGFVQTSSGLLTSCIPLFNGTADTIIASPHTFTETDFHFYNISPDANWNIAYGRVVVPNIGGVNVFCTHLVATGSIIPTLFEKESLEEAQELINYANSKMNNHPGELALLVGDFNSGPQTGDNTAVNPNTYEWIVNHGFTDSTVKFLNNVNVPCTFCKSNDLEHSNNEYIDHIFIQETANVCIQNSATFATAASVPVTPVAGSSVTQVPLSDHYGLNSTFCKTNTALGSTPVFTTMSSSSNTVTMKASVGMAMIGLAMLVML